MSQNNSVIYSEEQLMHEVNYPGLTGHSCVRLRTPKLLLCDIFIGNRLNYIWASDEKIGRILGEGIKQKQSVNARPKLKKHLRKSDGL